MKRLKVQQTIIPCMNIHVKDLLKLCFKSVSKDLSCVVMLMMDEASNVFEGCSLGCQYDLSTKDSTK